MERGETRGGGGSGQGAGMRVFIVMFIWMLLRLLCADGSLLARVQRGPQRGWWPEGWPRQRLRADRVLWGAGHGD